MAFSAIVLLSYDSEIVWGSRVRFVESRIGVRVSPRRPFQPRNNLDNIEIQVNIELYLLLGLVTPSHEPWNWA